MASQRPTRREARSPAGAKWRRSCTCPTTRPASSTAPTRARPTPRSARSPRSSAYPLGVEMSERAKRAQLEQAVQRLLERRRWRDDGHHAPGGGRRGAGRPCAAGFAPAAQLPAAPQGPVPHAVGDAEERRREFRDRRRRVPPAGDLRLHRPPDRGRRPGAGLRPGAAVQRDPAGPAQRVRRGRRFDVVVDSAGRRIIPRAEGEAR